MPAAGTQLQIQFASNYAENGGDATKAALAAGYSANSAAQIGYQQLQKPAVRELILKALMRLRGRSGAVGLHALVQIAEDPKAPCAARVAAARTLLEHAGLIGTAAAALRAPEDEADDERKLVSPRELLNAIIVGRSGVLQ